MDDREPGTEIQRETRTVDCESLDRSIEVISWGTAGRPVLILPTADADAAECERFRLIESLSQLIENERIRVYSIGSLPGQLICTGSATAEDFGELQTKFDAAVVSDVVPLIEADAKEDEEGIVVAGASFGAFLALSFLCRHPSRFGAAVCMSGVFDLSKHLSGKPSMDYYYASPMHFLPNLRDAEILAQLERVFVILAMGEGPWESPSQTWRVGEALGSKGIANRVDTWGEEYGHDWLTWRAMLPQYLEELTSS